MPPQRFDQTLSRFGLERLKSGLDLQVTPSGDIAITRDGDLQLGNLNTNGLFRFIERWRQSESTIAELFTPMAREATRFENLSRSRKRGEYPTLTLNPQAYHEITDSIIEAQLVASTLAGSIAVILNNLLQRLKQDLKAPDDEWHQAKPIFSDFSLGEIFAAAAANFRHYDEWASTQLPTKQQLTSMSVICGLLNVPVQTEKGFPSIRTNECGNILMLISKGDIETLHRLTVEYAKSLAKYK
ncbi:MAG: hypothetical protein GC139_06600 [Sideroxydans sp.]|nr:hypothetical protein [Sideroxydans sp.]